MSLVTTIRNRKTEAVICLVLFTISLVAYYPGFISLDTIHQYKQAVTHEYSDWHPPVMARFWSVFLYVLKGTWSMLLLQLGLFWCAAYHLLAISRKWDWYVAVIIFLFLGSTQNYVAYIIKDAQMALSWLFSASVMLLAIAEDRKLTKNEAIITAIFLSYGALVRINALPGFLPLAFMWSALYIREDKFIKHLRTIGIYTVVIIAVNAVMNIGVIKMHPENKLYMHDLSGIKAKGKNDVFPAWMHKHKKFDTAYITAKYHPASFDNIWWNEDTVFAFQGLADEGSKKLCKAWLNGIAKYPGTYLANRAEGFAYYLHIRKRDDSYMNYFPWVHHNDYGFTYDDNAFFPKLFIIPVNRQKELPYMYPMFWVVVNILLFPLAKLIKNRQARRLYIALALSSLLYLLPQFFIFQADGDFRYFYWNCLACSVCILMFVGNSMKLFKIKKEQ